MNDGGPAFPIPLLEGETFKGNANGMSLRDYFAAAATDADIAQWIPDTMGQAIQLAVELEIDQKNWADACSRLRCWARYKHADAMLRERNRGAALDTDAK